MSIPPEEGIFTVHQIRSFAFGEVIREAAPMKREFSLFASYGIKFFLY